MTKFEGTIIITDPCYIFPKDGGDTAQRGF